VTTLSFFRRNLESVHLDVLANLGGKASLGFFIILFTPLYIRKMGIEAYGLIGLYTSLISAFGLLDMGMAPTLNREMARDARCERAIQAKRDLLKTFQTIYCGAALLIGAMIGFLAPIVAHHWIRPGALARSTVENAIIMIGIAVAFQFPIGLYSGGLLGAGKQVLYNFLVCAIGVFRFGGAAIILLFVSSSIGAFFAWQAVSNVLASVIMATALWRSIARSERRAMFDLASLKSHWRFAAGTSGTYVLGIIIGQSDKLLLSKIVSLEALGYYSLAATIAASVGYLSSPVSAAFLPRFTQKLTGGDVQGATFLYHKAIQTLSILVLPASTLLIIFSRDILVLWTRSPAVAAKTHTLVSLLVAGVAINSFAYISYALQIANGWTRLGFMANLVASILFIPALILAVSKLGVLGAAVINVLLNGIFLIVFVRGAQRCLLKRLSGRVARNFGLAIVAVITIGILARQLVSVDSPRALHLCELSVVYIVLVAAAAVNNQRIKGALAQALGRVMPTITG
jgi:O-antigen/teichoic acid export membrane protein